MPNTEYLFSPKTYRYIHKIYKNWVISHPVSFYWSIEYGTGNEMSLPWLHYEDSFAGFEEVSIQMANWGRPLEAKGCFQKTGSKSQGPQCTITGKWILPSIWVRLEVDSPSQSILHVRIQPWPMHPVKTYLDSWTTEIVR